MSARAKFVPLNAVAGAYDCNAAWKKRTLKSLADRPALPALGVWMLLADLWLDLSCAQ